MQRATPSGARSIFTPSCSSTSAEPHIDDAARLPCLATRAPHAAATIAASVEMLKVARPSPPVPHVSSKAPSTWIGVATARAVRAKPVSSSTVSPFMRRATTKPAIWEGVASPRRSNGSVTPGQHPGVVVMPPRVLAMRGVVANDVPAEHLADALMTETHAEDRHLAAQRAHRLVGDACVVGSAGSRRDDEAV